jgi:hypothetical protein
MHDLSSAREKRHEVRWIEVYFGFEKICINLAFSYLVLVSPCILYCKDNFE